MDFLDLREPVSAWTHAAGLVLSLPATLLLWRRSRGEPAKRLGFLIFGLSLAACYAASTLYHGVRGSADRIAAFARLDYVGIYLLIAGSYTPLAGSLLRGRWRWILLASVWLVAVTASGLIAAGVAFPRMLSTGLYLGMGWGFVVCYCEIARAVSQRALLPLIVGGLFYSTGAVINLLGRPGLWPGVFGAHELFHLFVMAGSAAHFQFMLTVVVPFAPADGRETRTGSRAHGRRTRHGAGTGS